MLNYNPETGLWSKFVGKSFIPVGTIDSTTGYARISVGSGKYQLAHRLAVLYMTGKMPEPGNHVHHINGNKTDNRWENLEEISAAENVRKRINKYKKGYWSSPKLDIEEVRKVLMYDGKDFWRNGKLVKPQYVGKNRSKASIKYRGYMYSAARMAVFLKMGVYPFGSRILFRDGDTKNLLWENISWGKINFPPVRSTKGGV